MSFMCLHQGLLQLLVENGLHIDQWYEITYQKFAVQKHIKYFILQALETIDAAVQASNLQPER